MIEDKSIQLLKPIVRYNKNFVYKDKKYPIDFTLIKKNSNYFYERREQYKNVQDIQLAEEIIDISEDSIRCFISSCHNESFEINGSNVFSLHHLSIKYEVPYLTSVTDEFIKKNGKMLILQSIQYKYHLLKQNSNEKGNLIGLDKDEEYISSNFFDYINNEQLLNLPISVLYRIVNHPKLDINQMNETNKNNFIEFLFKCLNKYKKEASVLFLNLDLENQRIGLFSRLINEYSDVFDFSMISPKFLIKTTTDLLSELTQLKHNYTNSVSQIDQLLKQIESEKQNQQKFVDSLKKFVQDQMADEREKLNESFKNLKKQIENENGKLNESFQTLKKQIENENGKLNESFQTLKKQNENENENLKNEAAKNISEIKVLINQSNDKMGSFITKDILLFF